MFERILFVCVGNICRSPMAEIILRTEKPQLQVSSAGLGALVGYPAAANTIEVLQAHGFEDCSHKARQIDQNIVADTDLILVLESWHIDKILKQFPFARGKVHLLGKWNYEEEIPDPYQQPIEAFEQMYEQVRDNLDLWVKHAPL